MDGRLNNFRSFLTCLGRKMTTPSLAGGRRFAFVRAGAAPFGCWFYKGCGGCLCFFPVRLVHSNHSARLIAVQPRFSTVRYKTLNIFIKVCYSPPCLPNTILACLLFPLLENSSRAGNGSALSDSLPPLFSSLPTTNRSLSTLPPSPVESYRLPTPTL